MKKKILLQDISDFIAAREGCTKKKSDTFVRAFFEVVERGLQTDKFVKIKGFGTFKLVAVSERESVNINTGERFQISGHTKVSFTPDAALKDLVNRPFAHFESVDLNDETDVEEFSLIDEEMQNYLPEEEAESERDDDDAEADEIDEAAEAEIPAGDAVEAEAESAGNAAEPGADVAEPEISVAEPEEKTADTEEKTAKAEADAAETPDANGAVEASPAVPVASDADLVQSDAAPAALDENTSPEAADPLLITPATPAAEASCAAPSPADGGNEASDAIPLEPTNLPPSAETANALPETSAAPAETPNGEANDASDAAESPAAPATPADEAPAADIAAAESDEASASLAGTSATELRYTYSEVPSRRRYNWWRGIAICALTLIFMALSYFAGYYRLLCPCTFLEDITGFENIMPAAPDAETPAQRKAADEPAGAPKAADRPAVANEAETDRAATAEAAAREAREKREAEQKAAAERAEAQRIAAEKAAAERAEAEKAAAAAKSLEGRRGNTIVGTLQTYRVSSNDNLSRIARRFYGSDDYVRFIIKHNNIENADNIAVGSTLKLPKMAYK